MKNLFKSSIVGSIILTVFILIYSLLFLIEYSNFEKTFTLLLGLIKITPLLLFGSYISSLIYSLTIANFLYKYTLNNFMKTTTIINLSFYLGFFVGILLSLINYYYFHSLAKSFFIVIGLSMMGTGNALFFLILSKIIIIKENSDERKQGEKI